MYSKQEDALLRKKFWTSFGHYLAPIPSADGNKINWINYKTGIKLIQFKMNVTQQEAYIGVEISDHDLEFQQLYFNYFSTNKDQINKIETGNWTMEQISDINGNNIKRVFQKLSGINIYRQDDWPLIISFLKERIILLDNFWTNHKIYLEMFV